MKSLLYNSEKAFRDHGYGFVDLSFFYQIMKKRLFGCADCGEDSSILTQVSSGPEVIFLCSDCYNLKYSKEVQKGIRYAEEEKK